ncbi:MFS transporter [Agromyces aerolatus]|uniref:MFS transporter n=1 Tax=Agromyces sp. LY-1074 TaxID=3074080 RepID=UPI00285904D0|nr:MULTISPECIES: MFS transporter [unclassified Agromyces]MDR5701578.1 MFS transporter [Agromyces sp. LY-1074]MDR5706108.1 MFS transporter [Agromyces sp. LY-1358]
MNWRLIFVLFAVYAVGTNALILAGILPAIAEGLDTSAAVAGLGLTVFALTYAVIGPLLPIVLSRFGRRSIMAGGLLLFIGGTVLSGLAPDVATFMLSRAIVAVAAAAIPPQAAAIAIAITPAGSQGRALGMLSAGILLSVATGVPLGALLSVWLGYTGAFLFLASLGAIGLIGLCFVPATPRPPKATLAEQFAPFRRPAVLVLGLVALLFAWCQYSITTYFAPIVEASAGVTDLEVPVLLVIYGLAGVVAALFGGRLIDRFSGFSVATWGLVAISLTTPLFSIAPSFLVAAIVVVVWSLAQNATFPAAQVEMGRLHPDNPATTFALFAALVQAGGAVGAAVSAGVLDAAGPLWIPPVAAVASAAGAVVLAVLAAVLRRRGRRSC